VEIHVTTADPNATINGGNRREGTSAVVTVHVERSPRRGWSRSAIVELAGRGLGSVPPPMLVFAGIISVQLGAALAKGLFTVTGALGAVGLRLGLSAAVMLIAWRPSLRIGRRAAFAALSYGVVLAAMNMSFYQAISRIPLGVTVTIEFLGPLTVALLGSRRVLDVLWALLAAGGVVLLTEGGSGSLPWLGVLFALGAAACWGMYIPLSARLGERTSGGGGLAIAMSVAAVIAVPFGIAQAGTAMLHPVALAAGLGVALLSSVVPYSVELEALRRIPPRVFGVLMSLEPAVGALIGLIVLSQGLGPGQWAAIALVVAASVGATWNSGPTPPAAPES
jgi:inner membrane transporter RhtA